MDDARGVSAAHEDAESKVRIGEEVADVLLYLLQIADHSQIDIGQAVKKKLARDALKYTAKHAVGCARSCGDPRA